MIEDQTALALAVDNLSDPSNCCMKHLHDWRKRFFNSKGIKWD